MTISVGEATVKYLRARGVDTVFGIPGVHTLDFYRGFGAVDGIRHIQARNELGGGFMADGYARATGRPGVLLTISGPGVTNATTALGQAYGDSVPLLLVSAEAASGTLGKGWGMLHEVTGLAAVTAPLTAFSGTARTPADMPAMLDRAFACFSGRRPRPAHVAIPVDVLAAHVADDWSAAETDAEPPTPDPAAIRDAANLLSAAKNPVLIVGGGAAGADVTTLAERLGAIAISTSAGKGVVPSSHPLSLGGMMCRTPAQELVAAADVVLAIGTELAETDSFVDEIRFGGPLLRIDIEPARANDRYPAALHISADAKRAVAALLDALPAKGRNSADVAERAAAIRATCLAPLTASEARHLRLLAAIRAALPEDGMLFGDSCQATYTAISAYPAEAPRRFFYAPGYCALGFAFPQAIGAKLALPDRAVAALAGDGGTMFTVQELATAAEQRLPIPLIVWHNDGYKQIRDDMRSKNVPRIAVDGLAPDFLLLARAMHCHGVEPDSEAAFIAAVRDAFAADRPTVIVVREEGGWVG